MKIEDSAVLILKRLKHTYGMTMLARMGSRHDAFQVLIATVLSARARDETTEPLAKHLFESYGNVQALANAPVKSIETLVKKSGFYKVKARRIIELSKVLLEEHDGMVPDSMEELAKLPGVGRKTAGCVLVYSFGKQAIPVDTHVHRLSNRLGLVRTKTPERTEEALASIVPKRYWMLINELFVTHGKTVCKPITPLCSKCDVRNYCEYYTGLKQK